MKVLLVVLLIVSAMCYVDTQLKQKDIMETDYGMGLQESSLGRAILRLAQLQSQSQQVEFGRLFNAIDELEQAIQESKDQERQQFEQDYSQYQADVEFYRNQVTEFTNEVAQHDVDLSDMKDTRSQYEATLQQKLSEQSETQKLKGKLERQIQEDESVYQSQMREYDSAVSVLDEALALVEQVRSGSFVEVNSLQGASANMKEKLSSMKSQRIFYQPLVEALLEMSQEKFSDQQMVTKVLRLLQELRTQLNASRLSLTNSYNSQKQSNEQTLQQYVNKLNNLANVTIPQLQTDIETKNGEISAKSSMLNDAQNNLKTSQDNYDSTETAWVARQVENKKLNDQYNNELQMIGVTRSTLERAGIRRQN